MSLMDNIEDLAKLTADATDAAEKWVAALDVAIDATQRAKEAGLAVVKTQKAIQTATVKPAPDEGSTEDEIADPVPGGNGGVFKAVDAVRALAKGHGISDRGTFAPSDMTGGESDYSDEERIEGRPDGSMEIINERPAKDANDESDYAPDPEPEAKEGGAQ